MKIKEEHIFYQDGIIKIIKASYRGDFKIDITFSNNKRQTVDFKPFLLSHKHPDIQKYRDEKLFASFSIVNGNLNWNDFDMIFPISDLMNDQLVKS